MQVRFQCLAGTLALLLLAGIAPAAPAASDGAAPTTTVPARPVTAESAAAPVWAASPAVVQSEPEKPTLAAAAAQPAPSPRPRLSPAITSQIANAVPAWKKPPPDAKPKAPPPPDAPDVVRMAPVIVDAYRIPNAAEKEWVSSRARELALMDKYLTSFDRGVLNRYTIPLIGVSNEARARMMYEEDKRIEDLKWINDQIDQIKAVDPQAAKDLEKVRNTTFTRQEP